MTNPKIRLANLREDQRTLLSQIAQHRKEVEAKLTQLRALNTLIAEVLNEIEVDDFQDAIHHEREEREEVIESLEELVGEARKELRQQSVNDVDYINITDQQLSRAATPQSISRLYELAEQDNPWSADEASEFFSIADAARSSLQYELPRGMREAVNTTYEVVKKVSNIRGKDIEENYLTPKKPELEDSTFFNRTDNYQR